MSANVPYSGRWKESAIFQDRIWKKIYHYERLPKKEEEETVFHVELEQVNLVEAIAEKMSPYSDRQVMIEEAIEERKRQESIS